MTVHSPGTRDTQDECEHSWIFTAPRHIRCTKCPAVGRRNATKAERTEFKRVGWIYLMPARYTLSSSGRIAPDISQTRTLPGQAPGGEKSCLNS